MNTVVSCEITYVIISFNPTSMELDKCRSSHSAYTDLKVPIGNFLLLLLYMDCTTNKRSIPFGYLLQLLVQGYQGPFLYFLEFLQLLQEMLKGQEAGDQESRLEKLME